MLVLFFVLFITFTCSVFNFLLELSFNFPYLLSHQSDRFLIMDRLFLHCFYFLVFSCFLLLQFFQKFNKFTVLVFRSAQLLHKRIVAVFLFNV